MKTSKLDRLSLLLDQLHQLCCQRQLLSPVEESEKISFEISKIEECMCIVNESF
jgi:hypothetical protein